MNACRQQNSGRRVALPRAFGIFVALALLVSPQIRAANYSWTNYSAGDLSDYWTNSASWNPLTGTPGSGAGDNAYLTNSINLSYTNILNVSPAFALTTLAISNSLGQAWLIVTNGALNPTILTNTAFVLGSGGRLRIDSGGVVTGITSFTWLGTNGAIWLNNGGKLFTSGAKTIGAGGGVTGLVTSASGAGNGGVWDFNGGALTIGGASGNNNLISITGGAVVTNIGALTITGNQNSLSASNGGAVFGKGNIVFSAAAGQFGNTINLGAGTWDLDSGSLVVGGDVGASNNTFIGGLITNASGLWVGGKLVSSTLGAIGNSLIITNAGSGFFMTSAGGIGFGAAGNQQGGGVNNTVILSNSVLWGNNSVNIGSQTSTNNSVTLLANTVWNNNVNSLNVGGWGLSGSTYGGISNTLNVSGALLTNFAAVTVGNTAGSFGNRLVVNNGGILSNFAGLTVGGAGGADSNSVIVTNDGRLFMSSGALSIGNRGSGNTVIISNSFLTSTSAPIFGSNGSNNTLTLLAGTVWNNGGQNLQVGGGTPSVGVGNVMTVNAAIITNTGSLTVGSATGSISNQLIISNGGVVSNVGQAAGVPGFMVGGAVGADYNSVIASNGSLIMTAYGRIGIGAATIGAGGSYNTVILSNSVLLGLFNSNIGGSSSNNTVTLLGNSVWDNNNVPLNIGALTGYGNNSGTGNALTVNNSLVTNVSGLTVGNGAGNVNFGNSLTVTNGGQVSVRASGLAVGAGGSSNNTVTIVGTNSLLYGDGAGVLTIGSGASAGNRLLVSLGGLVSNFPSFTVGATSGGDSNSVIVTNGGRLVLAGTFAVGATTAGGVGSGGNTVILSNSALATTAATSIGSGSSNNNLTLQANTIWDNAGQNITVGNGAATGNWLNVTGATVTNVNVLNVLGGGLTLSSGGTLSVKQLFVTNNVAGGVTNSIFNFTGGSLTTSNTAGQIAANIVTRSNSTFNINGVWNMNGGANYVGGLSSSNAGPGVVVIGNGVNNAAVNVNSNVTWALNNKNDTTVSNLFLSFNGATNILTVNGGAVSNVGAVLIGGNNSGIIITNGGSFVVAGRGNGLNSSVSSHSFIIAGNSNYVTVTAGGIFSNSGTFSFYNGSYGTLTVSGGGQAWQGANPFSTAGNTVQVTDSNSVFTTASYLGLTGNRSMLLISNGGVVNANGGVTIGWQSSAIANSQIFVTGTGSVLNGGITMGYNSGNNGGGSNTVTVSYGGLVVGGFGNGGGGSGAGSSNNLFLVTNGGVVSNTTANLGSLSADNAMVRITGTNSLWFTTGGGGFNMATYVSSTGNGGNGLVVDTGGAFYNAGPLNLGITPGGDSVGAGSNYEIGRAHV